MSGFIPVLTIAEISSASLLHTALATIWPLCLCLFNSFLLMTQFWLGSPQLIPELLREGGMRGCWDGEMGSVLDKGRICFVYSPQLHSWLSALGCQSRKWTFRFSGLCALGSGWMGVKASCSYWSLPTLQKLHTNLCPVGQWGMTGEITNCELILETPPPHPCNTHTFIPTSATPHWITQTPPPPPAPCLCLRSSSLSTALRWDLTLFFSFSFSFITLSLPPLAVAHDFAAWQTVPSRFI